MTVGRVSGVSYVSGASAVGRVGVRTPVKTPAPNGLTPSVSRIASGRGSGNSASVYFSQDGDKAEISNRAMGLSRSQQDGNGTLPVQQNQQQTGPGIITQVELNLPSAMIDWSLIQGDPDSALDFRNFTQPQNAPPINFPSYDAPPSTQLPGGEMTPVSLEALEPRGDCNTCASRKYIDKSDDPSVSFQTPTNISPNMSAAAVISHENEHVSNERAKAARDDRQIINQSVTLTYDCCPECGKSYVSGGTTRTTSINKSDNGDGQESDASSEGNEKPSGQ